MIDPASVEWERLRKALDARIEDHRADLEQDHGVERTAKLRGKIAALRELIEEVEAEPPDLPVESQSMY